MVKKSRLAAIGCGGRTKTYMSIAATLPEQYENVAVADPVAGTVEASEVDPIAGCPPGTPDDPELRAAPLDVRAVTSQIGTLCDLNGASGQISVRVEPGEENLLVGVVQPHHTVTGPRPDEGGLRHACGNMAYRYRRADPVAAAVQT